MTNYYEVLGLSAPLGLDELNVLLDRAEAHWEGLRSENPEAASEMLGVVAEARLAFQTEESRESYDEGLGRDFNRRKWYGMAMNSFMLGGPSADAKSAIERSLGYCDDGTADPAFLFDAALVLYGCGDYGKALECADGAIRMDPESGVFHEYRGLACQRLGRNADALDALTRAIGLYEADDEEAQIGEAYGELADLYLGMGEGAKAREAARRAIGHGDGTGLGERVLGRLG